MLRFCHAISALFTCTCRYLNAPSPAVPDVMTSASPDLAADRDLLPRVCDVVRAVAAEEVMPRYLKVAHQRKSDGSLFTEADLAAQEALVARLSRVAIPLPWSARR